jgi:hypothetical protein
MTACWTANQIHQADSHHLPFIRIERRHEDSRRLRFCWRPLRTRKPISSALDVELGTECAPSNATIIGEPTMLGKKRENGVQASLPA